MNGYQDAIGLKGGDTVSVNGCTDTVDIGGTGNAITLSYSTLTIEEGAGVTVTGDASTITAATNASVSAVGNWNILNATGTGADFDLNGAWDAANVSSGTVTLESGSSGTVERFGRCHRAEGREYGGRER